MPNSQLLILLCHAQIPRLDGPPLGGIDVLFVLDVLDTDAHAVLGEDDIFAAHALRGRLAHLADAEVDVVADPGANAEDGEDDDQWEELAREEGGSYQR